MNKNGINKGGGNFGQVYEAKWNNQIVAAKVLKEHIDKQIIDKEIDILKYERKFYFILFNH